MDKRYESTCKICATPIVVDCNPDNLTGWRHVYLRYVGPMKWERHDHRAQPSEES